MTGIRNLCLGLEDKHRSYRIRSLRLEGYVLFNWPPSSTLDMRPHTLDPPLCCSANRGRSTDILAVGKEVERYHSHHYSYAVWKFIGTGKRFCGGWIQYQGTPSTPHRRPIRERPNNPPLAVTRALFRYPRSIPCHQSGLVYCTSLAPAIESFVPDRGRRGLGDD